MLGVASEPAAKRLKFEDSKNSSGVKPSATIAKTPPDAGKKVSSIPWKES